MALSREVKREMVKLLAGACFILLMAVACSGEVLPPTPSPTETVEVPMATVVPIPTIVSIPTVITLAAAVRAEDIIATSTPITLQLRPSNVELQFVPSPTPSPIPEATATATPPPTPSPTPMPVFAIGTVDQDIILPIAPNGLAGYILDIVTGPEVSLKGAVASFPLFSVNGNRLSAVDLNGVAQAGATNITLATITLEAQQVGVTEVQVLIVQLDDDEGFPINAVMMPGTIQVVP